MLKLNQDLGDTFGNWGQTSFPLKHPSLVKGEDMIKNCGSLGSFSTLRPFICEPGYSHVFFTSFLELSFGFFQSLCYKGRCFWGRGFPAEERPNMLHHVFYGSNNIG